MPEDEERNNEASDEDHENEMLKCQNVHELLNSFDSLRYNRARDLLICSECVDIKDVDEKKEKLAKNDHVDGEKLTILFLYKTQHVDFATNISRPRRAGGSNYSITAATSL